MTDDPEITDPRDPYRRPDIVTELDAWLDENVTAIIDCTVVRRARDEIAALRAVLDIEKRLPDKIAVAVRNAALEEAARLHENIDPACDHERVRDAPGAGAMGAVIRYRDAIRALKGPQP